MGERALTIAAIAGSLSIMALIVVVSQKVRGKVTLLIIGVMIGYIANAVIGVLKFFSVEEDIRCLLYTSRAMSHDISVETCCNVEINKETIDRFDVFDYVPQGYETKKYDYRCV